MEKNLTPEQLRLLQEQDYSDMGAKTENEAVASPPPIQSIEEAAKQYADSYYSTNIRSQHTLDLTLTDKDANEICKEAFIAGAEHQARQQPSDSFCGLSSTYSPAWNSLWLE